MSADHPHDEHGARPPERDPAAALPLGSREGLAPVAVTGEH